jgi:glyoxylate/hydroxypyruvate reductase A
MALLLTAFFGDPAEWRRLFAARMPELDVRIWPDVGDERDIDVAAIAVLPHGKLKSFPNLRMIVSLLAGADVLSDRAYLTFDREGRNPLAMR